MATLRTDKMERLAYDVFKHTMLILNTPTAIPPPECMENDYGKYTGFIFVLSRGHILYQLKNRVRWKLKFEDRFKLNGLKKWEQIEEFLNELLKEMNRKQKDSMIRIINSLALINELIQFLYSKNRRLFLDKLPILWRKYFSSFEEDFEKEGGLSHLYKIHVALFPYVNEIVDSVLSTPLIKYENAEVSRSLIGISKDSSSEVKRKKDIDRTEARVLSLSSNFEGNLSIDSRFPRRLRMKAEASSSLENPGLGIIPHEKRSDFFPLSAEKGTSVKKPIEETSATAKLDKKQCGQKSPKQEKEPRQPCTPINNPERWSKDKISLTRSSLNPEGRLKGRGSSASAGSPLSPTERLKGRGSPSGSPLSPERRLKGRSSPAGSPLSPEGRPNNKVFLTESQLSSRLLLEILMAQTESPSSPEGRMEDRGGPAKLSLSPEGGSKVGSNPDGSPLSPEGRLIGREDLADSPSSPQEQTHRRVSSRTPVGISRLEQKRRKYLQYQKT